MSAPANSPDSPADSTTAGVDQAVQSQPAAQVDAGSQKNESLEDLSYEDAMRAYMKWDRETPEDLTMEQLTGQAAAPAPEAEPETPAEQNPPEPDAGDAAEEEGQEPVQPADEGPNNFRISVKQRDEVDQKVLRLVAHNPDLTIAEAYRKVTGQSFQQAPADATDAPPTQAEKTRSIADIEAEKEQTLTEAREAVEALDFALAGELQDKAFRLLEQKMAAQAAEDRALQAQQQTVEQQWRAVEARTEQVYPQAAMPNSPLRQEMLAIHKAMSDLDDPTLDDPNSTMRIAQMAAARLNIAPATVKAAPAPAPVKAPATTQQQAAPVRPRPMAGGTTAGAANPANQAALLKQVESYTTEQWEAVNRSFED